MYVDHLLRKPCYLSPCAYCLRGNCCSPRAAVQCPRCYQTNLRTAGTKKKELNVNSFLGAIALHLQYSGFDVYTGDLTGWVLQRNLIKKRVHLGRRKRQDYEEGLCAWVICFFLFISLERRENPRLHTRDWPADVYD